MNSGHDRHLTNRFQLRNRQSCPTFGAEYSSPFASLFWITVTRQCWSTGKLSPLFRGDGPAWLIAHLSNLTRRVQFVP